MENQNYVDVLGDGTSAGCPSGTAPFLCSMLPYSSTIPNYHSYCSSSTDPACSGGIGGCSAACYTTVTSGNTYGVSDGVGAGSVSQTSVFDSLTTAGLTWMEFEEGGSSGTIRGPDHSPCLQYATTANSPNCVQLSGNLIGNSQLFSALNSANPPNYVWITPTDGHNMHDNSISSGDSWAQSFLVGSGTITNPASGSLLATSLFTNSNFHTLLWIWWDEYDPSPNIEYGKMVSKGFISQSNNWDEYSLLRMIEDNWGLPTLSNDSQASIMTDIVGTVSPTNSAMSLSLSINPNSPSIGAPVTFMGSASGGTGPYSYSWDFGDGKTGTGAGVQHSYASAGAYTVTMNATDSTGQTTTKTQQVNVGQTSPQGQLPSFVPTLLFLIVGVILGGVAGTVAYLAKYHGHNRRLRESMTGRNSAKASAR